MRPKKAREEIKLCPAIAFGQIVGGKYKLRILWSLRERAFRYGEIRAGLLKGSLGKAVTPRILSRELKELQMRGLIARRQFNEVPPRVEYSLTDTGQTLLPIIDAIVDWGLTGIHEEILGISPQASSTTP